MVVMVSCTKCGTENEEGANYCVNCGAALYPEESRVERRVEPRERRPRDECFGLPYGGAIAGLIFGMLIILFGLSQAFGWQINFWPVLVIIIGILIIAGAIYGLTRRS